MSPVAFRNVDDAPGGPVRDWSPEAVETTLDRGSLADWRRLTIEIRRSPWGPLARTVEAIISWGEHGGVDLLFGEVIARARQDLSRRGRRRWADHIVALRQATGLSLREFSALAGTSASRMSDYEQAKVAPTTDVLARLEHAATIARTRDG